MEERPTDGLSQEQRGQLAAWLAERQARMTALGHTPRPEGTLDERLRAMDAAFEASPDRDDEKAQENHELRRTVAILEEAVRALLDGRLPLPGATAN
ncbi:hypothetical protein LUX12_16465 [Streptomyces somaliensis]|uniref:hypothetical protein n=1 Tax=Streptomyces somaliensis TaxID=78355 RepID=UPI0020CE22B1|nr:hypothetical protein [Streptomyces somaliensis]MCP9946033.1 hypothetical protein [Streptomyces somaliensis]MCP9960798.1 hypothetical protein [Streptomyces somaliensis]MCP9973584.1 hypothetical protein [Streptomyces somaliensis]